MMIGYTCPACNLFEFTAKYRIQENCCGGNVVNLVPPAIFYVSISYYPHKTCKIQRDYFLLVYNPLYSCPSVARHENSNNCV